VEVCKSSSRLLLVRPSLWTSNHPTPLRTSRPRFKTRKASHQTSSALSLLVSNSKTAALFQITTSKRSPLFTWSSDFVEVCKSSSRLSLERPSLWTLSHQTQLRTSRLKSRTRKVSHQTSNVSSLLVSNSKTAALFQTTTSRRSPLFTWSSDFVEVCKSSSRLSLVKLSLWTSNHPTPLRTSRLKSRTRKASHQTSSALSLPVNN